MTEPATQTESLKNIPALRFPEFSGEWGARQMNKILKRCSNPVEVTSRETYREIGVRSHGRGLFHKEPVSGDSLGNKRVFWVETNALVLNIVFAWEQAVALTTDRERGMIASHRFPMYLSNGNSVDLKFLLYLFLTKRGKKHLEDASPGGAGRNKTLGQKEFDRLSLHIPSQLEQEKIAMFLGAVDERVEQLRKKHDLLGEYKKGVMQRIFLQDIRFTDDHGNPYPDWKEKKLGDVLAFPRKESVNEVDREKILTVKLKQRGVCKSTNTDSLNLGATKYYRREAGQFIYGKQNLFNGAFGIVPNELDSFVSSGDVPALDVKKEKIIPEFLVGYLGRETFYKRLEVKASGTGSKRIHEKILLDIEIKLPHPDEQRKIVDFLSAIDAKISAMADELAAAQQYKKALLQQMFV